MGSGKAGRIERTFDALEEDEPTIIRGDEFDEVRPAKVRPAGWKDAKKKAKKAARRARRNNRR